MCCLPGFFFFFLFPSSTFCFESSVSPPGVLALHFPRASQEANTEVPAHKEPQKHQRASYLFPPLATVGDFVWSDAQVSQHFGDAPGVHATVGSHVGLAAPVDVHLADCKETRRRSFQKVMA